MMLVVEATAPGHSALRSPLEVCSFVDDLDAESSGEIVFARGRTPAGTVFVEGGRICWAAAHGLARRLSNLLAKSARLDPTKMEALYSLCKRRGVPLGEHLVESGIVTGDDLRMVLLKHTAESLRVLCAEPAAAYWNPRPRRGGYSLRFTFSSAELLTRTFAESHGAIAEAAAVELNEVMEEGDWGAAFVRSESRASPDPVSLHGAAPDRVEGLLRLGRWAAEALDVVGVLQGPDSFLASIFEGEALVAWGSGNAILAGRTGVHGPARMLNRRAKTSGRYPRHGGI